MNNEIFFRMSHMWGLPVRDNGNVVVCAEPIDKETGSEKSRSNWRMLSSNCDAQRFRPCPHSDSVNRMVPIVLDGSRLEVELLGDNNDPETWLTTKEDFWEGPTFRWIWN